MSPKQTSLITGSNSGIGKELARHLAGLGHDVIMLARPGDKSEAALQEIREAAAGGAVTLVPVDLASFPSVSRAAEVVASDHPKLDLLVNNAGLFNRKQQICDNGIEATMMVNYFAPWLLTRLLLPGSINRAGGRIVNVGSEVYKAGRLTLDDLCFEGKYNAMKAYALSKLCLLLFSRELARRTGGDDLTVLCMHPGVIGTNVFRDFPGWVNWTLNLFITDVIKGAQPLIHLCTSDEVAGASGAYYDRLKQREPKNRGISDDNAAALWQRTEALVQEQLEGPLPPP